MTGVSGEGSAQRGLLAVLMRMFASFGDPRFRRYAVGAQLAYIGSWMMSLAQSLLILELGDGSGALLGLTLAIQFLPLLVLGPWVGVLADRVGAKRMLQLGEAIMCAVAAAEAAIVFAGAAVLPLIVALSAVFGVGMAMEQAMRSAVVVEIVGAQRIANAISLNSLFLQFGRFVGPAVAGVMIASWGYAPVFAGGAVLLGGFSLLLSTISVRPVAASTRSGAGLGAALRFIRADPVLPEVLLLAAVGGLVGPNFVTFATVILSQDFGQGAAMIGAAASCLAIGTIIGALVAAWRSSSSVVLVRAGAAAVGLSAVLAAVCATAPLYLTTLVVAGLSAMLLVTQSGSSVQSRVTGEMRGRVSAIFSICLLVGVPVGAPVFGVLSDALGGRMASAALGAAIVALVVVLTVTRSARRR